MLVSERRPLGNVDHTRDHAWQAEQLAQARSLGNITEEKNAND